MMPDPELILQTCAFGFAILLAVTVISSAFRSR